MNQYPKTFPTVGARPQRVAVVCAAWHADLVARARDALFDELAALGVPEDHVDRYDVPGAFEIPLHAQTLARSGRYAAIVGAALVVDGGVYRHDFVAQTVVQALMQVQLATETPVFSVVLTPHHFHDHDVHRRFFHEHFLVKGQEAARACVGALTSLAALAAAA